MKYILEHLSNTLYHKSLKKSHFKSRQKFQQNKIIIIITNILFEKYVKKITYSSSLTFSMYFR